jgi:1A family penicillin-binding protein
MVKKKKNKKVLSENLPFTKKVIRYSFYLFLFLCLAFIILGLATNIYFHSIIKDKYTLINNRSTGILLLDNKGDPFFSFYNGKRRKYIPLEDISKHVERAVVVSEDREFYQHRGISIRGIIRALGFDIKDKSLAYGGSTITQQLVKNVLLTPEKSLIRKYQEAVLAGQIESSYSKEEIMEMYLNSIYFGEGSFGIEDAAQTYYGKNAKDLDIAEASFLVGVLPSPSLLSPYNGDRKEAVKRQRLILAAMRSENVITDNEYENAFNTQLNFKNNNTDANNIAPHFALMVRNELIKKYGEENIVRSGFTVRTTLDTSFQEYAEVTVKNQVANLSPNKVSNGAAVVMDPKTGEVKALVGSADWANEKNGKVNMATAPRQPGSSFKPIVYGIAFEDRLITPASVLRDNPITYKDPNCPGCPVYTPRNYDGKFRGNVLARRALANSLNIPAVEVMQKVGVEKTLTIARELGIKSLNGKASDYGLSMVLGSGEVPLIEMVHAYSSFANKGIIKPLKLYTEIANKKGENIYKSDGMEERVWTENVAYLISNILSDKASRAEAFGNALNISKIAAVKTGTTNDYKDAWTIGYTPDLVVGVWVGNNDNTPMDQVAGSLGAAPIWRDLMEKFSEGAQDKAFEKPSGISELLVCRSNGLRAKSATGSAYLEYFILGTEPVRECRDEPKPTDQPDDNKDEEERLKELLERVKNDQNEILKEIEKRREERRGRGKD